MGGYRKEREKEKDRHSAGAMKKRAAKGGTPPGQETPVPAIAQSYTDM